MQLALPTGRTVRLTQPDKIKILSAAIRNGERSLRLMARVIGAEPCPQCDYIRSGCRCPKDE